MSSLVDILKYNPRKRTKKCMSDDQQTDMTHKYYEIEHARMNREWKSYVATKRWGNLTERLLIHSAAMASISAYDEASSNNTPYTIAEEKELAHQRKRRRFFAWLRRTNKI